MYHTIAAIPVLINWSCGVRDRCSVTIGGAGEYIMPLWWRHDIFSVYRRRRRGLKCWHTDCEAQRGDGRDSKPLPTSWGQHGGPAFVADDCDFLEIDNITAHRQHCFHSFTSSRWTTWQPWCRRVYVALSVICASTRRLQLLLSIHASNRNGKLSVSTDVCSVIIQ